MLLGLENRLLKRLLAWACTTLFFGASHAQTCKFPLPEFDAAHWQKEASVAQDKGLLWRLEKDGRTSWLLGTIHVNKPSDAVLGQRITTALRNSDVLAVELDLLNPAVMSQLMVKASADMPTLPAAMRQAVQNVLEDGCHPFALNPEALGRMLLIPSLTLSHVRSQGLFADYGVDLFMLGLAKALKKPVHSLETPNSQAQVLSLMLDGDTFENQVAQTLAAISSGKTGRLIRRMHTVWLTSDVTALEHYTQWCECVSTRKEQVLMQAINDARNPGLAQGIIELHDKGQRVFAAIGMLHMTGPQAVHRLLHQAGFRVTYLPLAQH